MDQGAQSFISMAVVVVSLALSVSAGGWLTKKTGRKVIGWPVAVALFFFLVGLGGMVTSALR